jgi:CheY-like chemotaxis protein
MDAEVLVLVALRESLGPTREGLARGGACVARVTVAFAGDSAIEREITVARRRIPTTGVLVVVAGEADVDLALARGADEVVVGTDEAALTRALERTFLRASARDAHVADGQVLAQVLTGVVRRLESPITALALDLEAFRAVTEPLLAPEGVALFDDCMAALEDLGGALRDAGLFARAEVPEHPVRVDVRAMIDQVLRVLGGALGLRAHIERDEHRPIAAALAPRARLARAIASALVHTLVLTSERADREALRKLRISLREDAARIVVVIEATSAGGLGASAARLVEPEGPLRLLREAVRGFGGDLSLELGVRGARLELQAPREQHALVELGAPRAPRSRTPQQPTVLLVDPDERVLRATARTLADRFEVLVAQTGEEALELAREQHIAVAVVNTRLPDVTAGLLLDELRHTRGAQGARAVLVASQEELDQLDPPPGVARVEKPVRREELLSAIERLLAEPAPSIRAGSSHVLN